MSAFPGVSCALADLGRSLFEAYPGAKRLWWEERARHNDLDVSPGLARWREMVEFVASGGPRTAPDPE